MLASLRPTRDFNFVKDTCEAFIATANSSKTIGEVVNSASNFEISVGETAELISKMMNSSINIESELERIRPEKSEVNRLYGCNKKIFSLTDWNPKYAGIDGFVKGLEKTIDWFMDPKNLELYSTNYTI